MHDCPNCGQACDCDGEDTWNDAASFDCEHDCEEEDDDGSQDGIEEGIEAFTRIIYPDFKPCPFCGCPDVREYVDDGFYCEQCGYGYIWTGQETEEQQVDIRKRWNTRPVEDALREKLESTSNEKDEALDSLDASFANRDMLNRENARLREALERIRKESIDCVAREIADQMLAHGW